MSGENVKGFEAPRRGRIPSEEQALWDAFAVAATPEVFYRTWLAIQCRMVPGVGSAVIVAGTPGIGSFSPWPSGRSARAA